MKSIICVKLIDYKGSEFPWNIKKEIVVPFSEVEEEKVGDEITYWFKKERIVLKQSWAKKYIDQIVNKALNDAFVAGKSKQSFADFKKEWYRINAHESSFLISQL